MYRIITALFICLFFVGCASKPPAPIPKYNLSGGDRVGILVDVGENPIHTHVGTTVFNNFVKTYPVEWDTDTLFNNMLVKELSSKNLEVVDLEKEGISADDIAGLVLAKSDSWAPGVGKENVISKLKALNLSSVILIREAETLAFLQCSGGPCTAFTTDGQGLFTRSFLGIKNYFAVAAYATNIYVLNPYADVSTCTSFRKLGEGKSMLVSKVAKVADLKNVSDGEWKPIKEAIINYMQRSNAEAANLVKNGCPDAT